MGHHKHDSAVSMLVGTFVNQQGLVRFQPKGKNMLDVRSELYEGGTFNSNVGRQVVVLGMIKPGKEIAIRAIFGLLEPTASDKAVQAPADGVCDSDVTLCYTWML